MENARLSIVDSLTAGTVRRFVTAERKARRPGRSATRTIAFMTYNYDLSFCRDPLDWTDQKEIRYIMNSDVFR